MDGKAEQQKNEGKRETFNQENKEKNLSVPPVG